MTDSIVLNVCKECGVSAADFFGPSRDRRLTYARRIAIERLHEAGFSYKSASRLIRRSYSTVQYWLHAGYRERRVQYYKKYHAARRQEGVGL